MGGFASIVRGALAGANDAAGNTQTAQSLEAANQRQRDAQQAQLRAKVLPHALAIRGLQEQLKATTDPTERAAITHDLTRNLEEISDVLYPDRNPQGNFFERGITDKLHLTSLKNRQDKLKALQDTRKAQAEKGGKAIAEGAPAAPNPFVERKEQLTSAGFTPEQTQKGLEAMAGITPKLTSDGIPYQGTDGKWYQNFKDSTGQITTREMPPNYTGPTSVDQRKRADFAQFKLDHPDYNKPFEEWVKNPSGIDKVGTPRIGTSGGKNVYALLTSDGWIDAGSHAPLKDFRPLPTFAQQGLYGIDMMQNADGTIGSALLNRRTGQFKAITASSGAPIAPQIFSQVSKSIEPAIESDTRFRVMKDNEKDALNGNQQAMLSLVANHMGMTLGQQKGTRINQAQWNEAIASAPWIEAKAAEWFHQDENGDYIFDGFKSGVTLTKPQIEQMVGLAQQRRLRQWQQAQQAGSVYGVNVPIPDDLETPSTTLEGPKTKSLKQARQSQQWSVPADAPPVPKEDNKYLKANGQIIAVSKGGKWVQP